MEINTRDFSGNYKLDRNELFPELIEVDPNLNAELLEEKLMKNIFHKCKKIRNDIIICLHKCKTTEELKRLSISVDLLNNNPVLRHLRERFLNEQTSQGSDIQRSHF